MKQRSVFAIGLVCIGIAATASPAGAQAEISPIVVRPATEHPNCQIYLRSDGGRLLFKGKPVSASGSCPSDYMRGTLARTGPGAYRIKVSGTDCIVTPAGLGPCR
jgi:hypothetical protein